MSELSRGKVKKLPLGICVADTEGAFGLAITRDKDYTEIVYRKSKRTA